MEPSEDTRKIYEDCFGESHELRRQIHDLLDSGMNRKAIAGHLGVSHQLVTYQLKFSRPKGESHLRKLEAQLADALTREAFLREALRLQTQMHRRLWWKYEGGLPRGAGKTLR